MKLGNYMVEFHHQNNVNVAPLTQRIEIKIDFPVPEEDRKAWGGREIITQVIPMLGYLAPDPSFTECRIFTEDPGHLELAQVGVGISAVHDGDNFCYETGRRISLERAMESASFDKATRTDLWEAYRTSTPTPRWGPDELESKTLGVLEEAIALKEATGYSLMDCRVAVLRLPSHSVEQRAAWLKGFLSGRTKRGLRS